MDVGDGRNKWDPNSDDHPKCWVCIPVPVADSTWFPLHLRKKSPTPRLWLKSWPVRCHFQIARHALIPHDLDGTTRTGPIWRADIWTKVRWGNKSPAAARSVPASWCQRHAKAGNHNSVPVTKSNKTWPRPTNTDQWSDGHWIIDLLINWFLWIYLILKSLFDQHFPTFSSSRRPFWV